MWLRATALDCTALDLPVNLWETQGTEEHVK